MKFPWYQTLLCYISTRDKNKFLLPQEINFLQDYKSNNCCGWYVSTSTNSRKLVFDEYKNNVYDLCHLWNLLKMKELTEIMRQKDDQPFTELLNRFRTASQTEEDDKVIQSKTSFSTDANYTHHNKMLITPILHIFFLKMLL